MSRKPAKAEAFLSAMQLESEPPVADAPPLKAIKSPATDAGQAKRAYGRQGLKHIGGYLEDEAVERFALLKVRTKLGNDALLTRAINALWKEVAAEKAFRE